METTTNNGLPNTSGIHGRNLTEDLERMNQDLDLQRAAAVLTRYSTIKSIGHLAEILKITREDSAERLECLQNLNIIDYVNGSYVAKVEGNYDLGKYGSPKERKQQHSHRLIQAASLIKTSDNFSDLRLSECSSQEVIKNLQKDILDAFEKFRTATGLLRNEDKNTLLTLVLGYTEDNVSENSGDNHV